MANKSCGLKTIFELEDIIHRLYCWALISVLEHASLMQANIQV